jgi:hypothetical protein
MEIGYVARDAAKWEVDTEGDASVFDAVYYGKLLEKAWDEVAFVLLYAIYIIDCRCEYKFTGKNVRVSLSPHKYLRCIAILEPTF